MNAAINQLTLHSDAPARVPFRNLVVLATENDTFSQQLVHKLRQNQPEWRCSLLDPGRARLHKIDDDALTGFIYAPRLITGDGMTPDVVEAKRLFDRAAIWQNCQFVLLSSALIYGTAPGRRGFAGEDCSPLPRGDNHISDQWNSLEELAHEYLHGTTLTILRPAIILSQPGLFNHLFSRRLAPALPGHDPALQLLSLSDLAGAVLCALDARRAGTFNVAPDRVVPLHQAIRLGGGTRLPIPRTLQRPFQRSEALDFLRYSWTISNEEIKRELGFIPCKSSVAALREFRDQNPDLTTPEPQFDEFGMDKSYIRFYGRSLFKFLSEYYWRIEHKGIEHVPRQGRGVLVGMHRGFMPWDGVMALHAMVTKTGRYPRFLTHSALLKFPFFANFMTKLGGVAACQENADRVLESGELLGIFPEGIHGAFTHYRKAYKLQAFGRDAFVKLALRHRAPIIPFVTVGSAEIFPIFGKIKSRAWTRYAGWPCIPITPTFPLLPLPLPSKWHTQFLPPIAVDQYPPDAAKDQSVVKTISREVRAKMQQAVDDMVARRRSVFFGSIFERRTNESQSKLVAS